MTNQSNSTQDTDRVAFLRRTAAEMRSKRNLRGAMEIEKIADELEAKAQQ